MKFFELLPGSLDQKYIEDLSNALDIDYTDADIYINENTTSAGVTNQTIYFLISQGVQDLDIPDKIKEDLQENIYLNCLASFLDVDVEKYPKKYSEIIQDFKDLIW